MTDHGWGTDPEGYTDTLVRSDDLTDTEFWLLVEPGEASECHWWVSDCYRCGGLYVTWLLRTTPPWSGSRPEEDPLVVAAVLADSDGMAPMAYLEFRTTRPVPDGYMAFCCPECHATQGDFFLFEEFKKLLPAGGTHIVSVSI